MIGGFITHSDPAPSVLNPRTAVAYLRVADAEQDCPLAEQRASIERWSGFNGIDVVAWHEDVGRPGEGPGDRRPGFHDAIEAVGRLGAGLLVVARRDRLGRDIVIAAVAERIVERRGARVVSVDGDAESSAADLQLRQALIGAFSQYDDALERERLEPTQG
ncbi:MAG: recombinase family protein [Planctomycetota bacterium]